MKDKKTSLIIFLSIVVISLFTAFVGKIVAIYFEFKPIYGILIGFFIPAGIRSMLQGERIDFEGALETVGVLTFILIVPTFGLSIIFVPLIAIIIFIISIAIKGVKEIAIILLEFLSSQSKEELKDFSENQSKNIKRVKNSKRIDKDKDIVERFEKKGKDMKIIKSFENCNNTELLLSRLEILRENITKHSNGELIKSVGSTINVDWNWINHFEIRLDNDKNGNIRIEIWVADVKHQWIDLAKVNSMDFVSKQEPKYLIKGLDINVEHYVGAYVKLGDSYGKTLAVTDYKIDYVKSNLNKQYYKEFYNTIGGQWKKDLDKDDFIRNGKLLTEEIQKLPLVNKDKLINYIKNETRKVINLSLGTTVNISIPINELARKDTNFNYEKNIDELAKPLYDFIMEYKNKIES